MYRTIAILLTAALLPGAIPAARANNTFGGVNLAGAEFGTAIPGQLGIDYIWPTVEELDYFHARGMNIVRIGFRWERMQPTLNGPLDADYLASLDALVAHAASLGIRVILNPHNFARYGGVPIGSPAVPHAAFADFWSRLATHHLASPHVVFGLMNEPMQMPTEQWLAAANAAIAAIRASGAQQLVLVPGNAWTGAHSWEQNWYGTPNAVAMLGIVDSGNHYAFELHQYFDADYSGTSTTCLAAPGTGASQLQGVTAWLRTHGYKGFLAELAGADNPGCHSAVDNALGHLRDNADVWLGWTWWAAGPWWGDYMFTLEPSAGFSIDAPQMAWLTPYLPPIFADGFDGG
ncbi:MAG: glycoside hydrolase family 5 protein [Xanthomonadales bacterium]|nr:glycoside hydrolase family 5 protein [Xanthomonadales bacterium]MDL1869499.1 glycoside hydrolase family 5 protein [Gammaproteobacteria bacterium PRO6]